MREHCYVTGGSTGLGKALAIQLVKRGAHVTIVARDSKKLAEAKQELKVSSVLFPHLISIGPLQDI